MTQSKPTGGPAFPIVGSQLDVRARGMDLRDYAAIHSTQPGVVELCAAAGVQRNEMGYVLVDGQPWHFDRWWESLGLELQCQLSAKVRYAQADAMMLIRSTT